MLTTLIRTGSCTPHVNVRNSFDHREKKGDHRRNVIATESLNPQRHKRHKRQSNISAKQKTSFCAPRVERLPISLACREIFMENRRLQSSVANGGGGKGPSQKKRKTKRRQKVRVFQLTKGNRAENHSAISSCSITLRCMRANALEKLLLL